MANFVAMINDAQKTPTSVSRYINVPCKRQVIGVLLGVNIQNSTNAGVEFKKDGKDEEVSTLATPVRRPRSGSTTEWEDHRVGGLRSGSTMEWEGYRVGGPSSGGTTERAEHGVDGQQIKEGRSRTGGTTKCGDQGVGGPRSGKTTELGDYGMGGPRSVHVTLVLVKCILILLIEFLLV